MTEDQSRSGSERTRDELVLREDQRLSGSGTTVSRPVSHSFVNTQLFHAKWRSWRDLEETQTESEEVDREEDDNRNNKMKMK